MHVHVRRGRSLLGEVCGVGGSRTRRGAAHLRLRSFAPGATSGRGEERWACRRVVCVREAVPASGGFTACLCFGRMHCVVPVWHSAQHCWAPFLFVCASVTGPSDFISLRATAVSLSGLFPQESEFARHIVGRTTTCTCTCARSVRAAFGERAEAHRFVVETRSRPPPARRGRRAARPCVLHDSRDFR